MKITLIGPFPPFRGGIADFNLALTNELTKSHEVQIINYTTQYPRLLFPGETQYKSSVTTHLNSERILSSINPLTWRKTARKIIAFQPNLILTHYWMPFFVPALIRVISIIKRESNAQTIAICHNLIPHEKYWWNQFFMRKFIEKIDKFMLMSKSVKDDLLKIKPNAEFQFSPHPIYDIFGRPIEKPVARKKLGLKSKNIILFFGLIRVYKGLDILLKSIPQIQREIDDFCVVVAGECYEDENKYKKIIDSLRIHKNVDLNFRFIPDDEVKVYFSAADVIAIPYRSATQSGITQIAFNFNRPVIVSDVGGLGEIVPNGKVGFVVRPQPQEFADAIIKFFKKNKFQEFSNNIRTHKKLFFWDKYVKNLMELADK